MVGLATDDMAAVESSVENFGRSCTVLPAWVPMAVTRTVVASFLIISVFSHGLHCTFAPIRQDTWAEPGYRGFERDLFHVPSD